MSSNRRRQTSRALPHWLESLKGDSGTSRSVIRCPDRKILGAAMAWRQGQSYSEDLRARVLAAVDAGMAARAAARGVRVSVSYIYKAPVPRRRTREVGASSRPRHPPPQPSAGAETRL